MTSISINANAPRSAIVRIFLSADTRPERGWTRTASPRNSCWNGLSAQSAAEEDTRSDPAEHILKIMVVHGADREDPVDVSILLEGREMFPGCDSTAKAFTLLMGVVYALNLAYPPTLRYTLEVFQKLFLDLDGVKMSPKEQSLKLSFQCWME